MQSISYLEINNYKSINKLVLSDCRRINVFIGEPNVGKSNILEALDLSYLSWMLGNNESRSINDIETVNIKEYFRVNKVADLFHQGDLSKSILIKHPGFTSNTELKFIRGLTDNKTNLNIENIFAWDPGHGGYPTYFDNDFKPLENSQYYSTPVKPYRYKENIQFHDVGNYLDRMMPPFGNNLLEVIKYNSDFAKFIGGLIKDFDLELNVDTLNHQLLIQKRINQGVIFPISYQALADTLRRIIFYTAVIRYNNGAVITLEEPDAHAFPKFVSFLADEIISNRQNQFFLATHNPYLLNKLIEDTSTNDLAIFICGYHKDSGTVSRKLSQEDLSGLLDYGIDIFFNINHYLDGPAKYNS